MLKKTGRIILGLFLLFIGAAVIESAFTDPDIDSIFIRVVFCVLGAFFAIPGIRIIFKRSRGAGSDDEKIFGLDKNGGILKGIKSDISPHFRVVEEDRTGTESLIRSFRKSFSDFFSRPGIKENDPLQNYSTQVFWHSLFLQKKRMDRNGITSTMESERLRYGKMEPVRENSFFDGKYRVSDVSETIEAKQFFRDDGGRTIHTKKSLQTARYRILDAEGSGNQVICPNCGNKASRENLIDGCDHCGTKFTIEDLGPRVSGFGFRQDYEAQYARYTDIRKTYGRRIALFVGVPFFILCILICIFGKIELDGSYALRIAAIIFACAFISGAVVFFAELQFFLFLFPFLQAKASITYLNGKHLEKMKELESENTIAESRARSFDPLFSLSGFFASVRNILSVIHFSDTEKEASAFAGTAEAEDEIASFIPGYSDVFDMEADDMTLSNYEVAGRFQKALVTARLTLLKEKDGAVTKETETVRMQLIKSASCKTQAVCAPSFTRCGNCGSAMSLLDGRECPFCGTVRNLSASDWAVEKYRVM